MKTKEEKKRSIKIGDLSGRSRLSAFCFPKMTHGVDLNIPTARLYCVMHRNVHRICNENYIDYIFRS